MNNTFYSFVVYLQHITSLIYYSIQKCRIAKKVNGKIWWQHLAIKSFGTWSSPNWMVYILWHQQYFKKSKALAHYIRITYRYWSKIDVWSAIKVMREREREREKEGDRERMFKRIKGKWICTNLLMIRALFLLMVVSWQYIWLVEAISYFLKKRDFKGEYCLWSTVNIDYVCHIRWREMPSKWVNMPFLGSILSE